MKNSKEVISNIIQRIKKEISDIESVYEIRLFGSQVNEYTTFSDIDIYILCENNNYYEEILEKISKIINEEKILIHPIIKDINDKIIDENRYFKKNIIEKSILIYRKKCTGEAIT